MMLHRKKEIQFIFAMTVINRLNSTAEAAQTLVGVRTLGALGKMLYDSKMITSCPLPLPLPFALSATPYLRPAPGTAFPTTVFAS
jgi:hypothetical protein